MMDADDKTKAAHAADRDVAAYGAMYFREIRRAASQEMANPFGYRSVEVEEADRIITEARDLWVAAVERARLAWIAADPERADHTAQTDE